VALVSVLVPVLEPGLALVLEPGLGLELGPVLAWHRPPPAA